MMPEMIGNGATHLGQHRLHLAMVGAGEKAVVDRREKVLVILYLGVHVRAVEVLPLLVTELVDRVFGI